MAKRPLSDEERKLFESAMGDYAPLKRSPRPRKKQPDDTQPAAPRANDRSERRPAQEPATQTPIQKSIGIDGNTAERLRRGQLEPEARLDLHGMSERDAHRALITFVRAASARKLRLLLVITGKGGGPQRKHVKEGAFDLGLDMRMRGILRDLTPRWLHEPGLAEIIADVRQAHRRHGDSGALYVYLRKGKQL